MLILASASPRRKDLLEMAGFEFTTLTANTEETIDKNILPRDAALILAERKAKAVLNIKPNDTIIGSDTIVELEGEILGKPIDTDDAVRMLSLLSGKKHFVHTGVAILRAEQEDCFVSSAEVEFYPLTREQIELYVSTGEPMDKAGAYGIQGRGALLIKGIVGDFYSVMGLPIAEVYRRISETL